jgi:hypothetical protein
MAIEPTVLLLRLPACLFGCLGILGLFLLGRHRGGAGTGLFAAALYAFSPPAIELAQVARPYTLAVAATSFALYFLSRALSPTGSRRDWLMYSLCCTCALLTHYSCFLVIGAVLVALTAQVLLRQIPWRATTYAQLVPVASMVALFFFHIRPRLQGSRLQDVAQTGWLHSFFSGDPAAVGNNLLGVWVYLFGYPLLGLSLLVWFVGVAWALLKGPRAFTWVSLLTLGAAVLASATSQYPFGCSRHSFYLVVVLAVPMGYALRGLLLGGSVRAALAGVVLACLYALPSSWQGLLPLEGIPQSETAEQITRAEEVQQLQPILDEIFSTPGVAVMDLQTFYTLAPYLQDARPTLARYPQHGFRHLRVGPREVVVSTSWTLSGEPDAARGPGHLLTLLREVDTVLPDLQITRQDSAWLLFAGWTMPLAAFLRRTDPTLPPKRRMLGRVEAATGFIALEMNLARYWQLLNRP